jgi:hypothetical protein
VKSKININKIGLQDQVVYTLTVTGTKNLSLPELSDLKDFKVMNTSSSSKFSLVDDKSSISNSFVYYLKPLRTGNLKVPAQVFNWGGKKYIASQQLVEVVPGSLKAARDALKNQDKKEKMHSFFDQ